MSFEPCSILFYGGPWHGRITAINDDLVIVTKTPPPKFWYHADGSTEVGVFHDLRFYYRLTRIKNLKINIGPSGVRNTQSSAFVMMCDTRKYDENKVWRMMERYKIMPGYQSFAWPVPQH